MSFFDDGDETEIRGPRPRRPAPDGSPGGDYVPDHQTMMVRRGVAAGVALVVAIVLIIGIKGCVDSQRQDALRAYGNDVGSIIGESDGQVGQPFFALLSGTAGKDPLNVEVSINNYRDMALQEARRAQALSVPGSLVGAQRAFLLVLDLRAEALGKVADQIRTAMAKGSAGQQDAANVIAGEMQEFLASDVVYSQRVKPLIAQTLSSNGISTGRPPDTNFLADLTWLDPVTVLNRLSGGGGGATGGQVAPGLHGHALTGVSFGGQPLSPAPTVNRLTGAGSSDFTVTIANQGTNDETGVKVDLSLTGSGPALSASKTIDQTKAGANASVVIPLSATPPTGVPLRLTAKVEPVPGEKNVSNNQQSFVVVLSK